MLFLSTRGGERVTAAQAILYGLADNGGLYVPETFPEYTAEELNNLLTSDYPERVANVLSKFLDGFDFGELLTACQEGYKTFGDDPAPLVRIDDGVYILELFHGPTCSFKDMSLALLPCLMEKARDICGEKRSILILTATSGDTGKATLEAFKNRKGFKVLVLYPDDGISKIQKLQMCTQEGENVNVLSVRGNFDVCQTAVKDIFTDKALSEALKESNYVLSSANSINFGRLVPQIAFYLSAYLDMVSGGQIEMGQEIDFSVPTGNFGNILAAYYAKRMGVPIRKLHCATNMNNVLFEFFNTGAYDINRNFYKTTSPSMDIAISSNLERLIFEASGRNAELTASRMEDLKKTGKYALTKDEKNFVSAVFTAGWANEDEVVETVYDLFCDVGYTMDPHTGCAMKVCQEWYEKNKNDNINMIVVATTNPYKFPQDVLYCVTGNDVKDSFKGIKRLHAATAMTVPKSLSSLKDKPIIFNKTVTADAVQGEVLQFAKK